MKYATFLVSLRTSCSSVWPGGIGAVTSNQSCKLSLVVPGPTNCFAGAPFFVRELSGLLIGLEKLTFNVSGLNCTTAVLSGLISDLASGDNSRSSAFARSAISHSSGLRLLQGQRFVCQL